MVDSYLSPEKRNNNRLRREEGAKSAERGADIDGEMSSGDCLLVTRICSGGKKIARRVGRGMVFIYIGLQVSKGPRRCLSINLATFVTRRVSLTSNRQSMKRNENRPYAVKNLTKHFSIHH